MYCMHLHWYNFLSLCRYCFSMLLCCVSHNHMYTQIEELFSLNLLIHIWCWWFNTDYNKYLTLSVVGGQLCHTNSINETVRSHIRYMLQSFGICCFLYYESGKRMKCRFSVHTHTQFTFECDKCLSLSREAVQIVS